MTEHLLNIWPEHFDAVASGQKTVELRKDDRGYAVGDALVLREWFPPDGDDWAHYSGNEIRVIITEVTRGEEWLQPGVVVLSIRTQASADRLTALERLYKAVKRREGLVHRGYDYDGISAHADEFRQVLRDKDAVLSDLARMEAEEK